MKTTMRRTTFPQLLGRISPKIIIAAFVLMLLSILPLTPAHAFGLCPVDRPCITGLYQQGHTIFIQWSPNGSYDGFNIHWSRPGYQSGFHVDGTSSSLTNAHPYTTYTFSVEGCNTHFLAPSTCSPWSFSEQITTGG